MKIRWLSNGLYSLKNCHKQFGQAFRPPPPFGQCPNLHSFSRGGASLNPAPLLKHNSCFKICCGSSKMLINPVIFSRVSECIGPLIAFREGATKHIHLDAAANQWQESTKIYHLVLVKFTQSFTQQICG